MGGGYIGECGGVKLLLLWLNNTYIGGRDNNNNPNNFPDQTSLRVQWYDPSTARRAP